MKIEIEVVSREIMRPSTPTPNDLSNYKLSYLDQIQIPAFLPHTLFYKANNTNLTKSEISSRLKHSLSKTLSLYYPVAGRIVDDSYVHCNDQGITYVEAQADCPLLEFMNDEPNNIVHELEKFLPPAPPPENVDVCLVVVQTTFFKCGGVAIGIAVSHQIFDGCSLSLFVNTWAAVSRGDDDALRYPILDGASLFPPRDMCGYDPRRWMSNTQEEEREIIVTKIFRFTCSKINDLRDVYSDTLRATRIEALTAFIWTRFMASTAASAGGGGGTETKTKQETKLFLPIDIRRRAIPPLSSNLFGNFVQFPMTTPLSVEEQGIKVVEKMREAINSIDGDHVNKLREGNQAIINAMADYQDKRLRGELSTFVFTSLCGFPLYEADFGWSGKPIWFGLGAGGRQDRVCFTDWVVSQGHGGSGGGIEAWITLKMEDMAKFEADQEFLEYTAP